MNNPNSPLTTISAAENLLDWYETPSDDEFVLAQLLPQPLMEEVFHVRGGIHWVGFFKRYLVSDNFQTARRSILAAWNPHRGSLTHEQAHAVFLQHAEFTDHALLYRNEIAAGLTQALEGIPASDFTTAYHAGRTPWTLHMTVAGGVDYVAGNIYKSRPGELLLFSPQASLHYKRSPETNEWRHYWALFEPPAHWLEFMDWPLVTYGIYRMTLSSEADQRALQDLLENMVALYDTPSPVIQRLLENLLEQFFIRAHATQVEMGNPRTDARVLKACAFIEQNLAQPLAICDIAKHCSLSESRLAHLFKDNLNQSVKGFHDALRMQRAKRLLATTTDPVALVGSQIGYEDAAQFSKFFRRHMQCSPRAFRDEFAQ